MKDRTAYFREWRARNKDRVKEYNRITYQRNRQRYIQKVKDYQESSKERTIAHNAVSNAIRDGRLTRPSACERCGKQAERVLEAHHEDYSRRLDVIWLCPTCHKRLHKWGKDFDA